MHRDQIVNLAAKHRLPAIYGFRAFVDDGGLVSYAPNLYDLWRRAATYVDKILKGAKPADLPVEQPTTFELVINLKTAKALGLTIPPVAPAAGGSGDRVVERRRFLLTSLVGALAAPPLTTEAQQAGRTYRLGANVPLGREHPAIVAFFDELRLFGFIENQNLTVIPGGFKIGDDQLAQHAPALVKAAPDVILSGPDNYTRVMQQTTQTIPLIAMTEDMVAAGFVTSLARPGGNTTGISLLSPELDGKRQDILIEAVPGLRKMAALVDSTVTPQRHLRALQDAARSRGVELAVFGVARREEVLPAIEAAKVAGAGALNLLATPLFVVNSRLFIDRIAALRLPAMHQWPELAEDGGLMGYGPRFTQTLRQLARLVVRVLRGGKPADIPVEQPIHFELALNLKAAKALGLTIPQSILLRADQVIE